MSAIGEGAGGPAVAVPTPVPARPVTPAARRRRRRGPAARALERPAPVGEQRLALVLAHPRLVAGRLAPHLAHLLAAPAPGRDPGQVGGAERGRLGDLGHDHRGAEHVGLELHQPAVGDRAAVGLQHLEPLPRRRLLGAHRVDRLVGDRLQRRPRQVRAAAAAGEADDRAARVGVPVRRAEPGQRGDEVDAVVAVQRGRQRLGLRRPPRSMPEPVAQPLHRGAGDEDRGLQRVGGLLAEPAGDRGQQARRPAAGASAPVLSRTKLPVP